MASKASAFPVVLLAIWGSRLCWAQGAAPYQLSESYRGPSFFEQFVFWTQEDPTKGAVRYVGEAEAAAQGLIRASEEEVYIGSDSRTVVAPGEGRRSVRIQSRNAYNAGLFVARIKHMPTGCGTWPALWMYGEDLLHPWPQWGEFDIAEGVHEQTEVMTSLHTDARCNQEGSIEGQDFTGSWMPGDTSPVATDCNVASPGQFSNQGCSQKGIAGSYGDNFNANGGGTYVAEWDPDMGYIRTWFWPVGAEPEDLRDTSGTPRPESWGQPYSKFVVGAGACASEHFVNMRLVLNLNFCGDLADATWAEGCPDLARQMTCREFVEGHPNSFTEAFWSIGSIDVYQRPGPLASSWRVRTLAPDLPHPQQPLTHSHWSPAQVLLGLLVACAGLVGIFIVMRGEWAKQASESPGGVQQGPRSLQVIPPGEASRGRILNMPQVATRGPGGNVGGPARPPAVSWDSNSLPRSRTTTWESISGAGAALMGQNAPRMMMP